MRICKGKLKAVEMSTDFDTLIRNLESEDSKVQREAVLALGYDGAGAVPALIQAIRENVVSLEAVTPVFRQIGEPTIDPLTDMLHSDNNEFQRKAAHLLAAVGHSRALVQLIITLDDEDPLVRAEVASALGNFKDARAMGPLLKAIQDKEPRVRGNAALSLGKFNDEKITDALLMAMEDKNPLVRQSAIRALADNPAEYIASALNQATRDPAESVRQTAAAALQHRKGDSVAFERLNLEGDITEEMKATIEKVMEDGKLDTQDMELLRHSNPRIRSELLQYISEKSGPQLIRLMIPGLNDINPAVRTKAVSAITNVGPKGINEILELLPEQKSPYTRASIAEVLGNLGDKRGLPALLYMLKDDDDRVVSNAITAVSQFNDPETIDPLVSLLRHPEDAVRTHAGVALRKLGYDPRNEGTGMRKIFKRLFGDKGN